MTDVLKIRASRVDEVWACPETIGLTPEGVNVDPANAPADLGIAAHDWGSEIETPARQPAIEELADRYGVDLESLEAITSTMRRFWYDELRQWLAGAEAEVPLEYEVDAPWLPRPGLPSRVMLRGHADHLLVKGDRVFVHDWKTGRKERRCAHQLRAYAMMALARHPECKTVWAAISYPRLNPPFIDARLWTRGDLEAWLDELLRRILNGYGTFRPGEVCTYCPRWRSCPGYKAFFNETVALMVKGEIVGEEPTHAQMGKALRIARLLATRAEEIEQLARRYATGHGGEILPKDGTRFEMRKEKRRSVNLRLARPIIAEYLSIDQIDDLSSMPKGKLVEAVKATARNGKARRAAKFLERLENAGALTTTTQTRLTEVIIEQ